MMHKIQGGCCCGNITYLAELTDAPATYNPRSCDCKFCTTHGALYVSDSKGTLTVRIKNKNEVNNYRQGSRIADFLICKNCGVMTNVFYEDNGCVFGSVNIRSADDFEKFGEGHVAHLAELSDEERIKRWKHAWFSGAHIVYENE